MKLLQINARINGSTGAVMRGIDSEARNNGIESYMAWARGGDPKGPYEIKIGSKYSVYEHALFARLTDKSGLFSKAATIKLIDDIGRINPSVVHLHVLHGYYINYELLFDYLSSAGVTCRWTMHDAWAITGHCAFFSNAGCEKWKRGCECCPLKRDYPKSLLLDNSRDNWRRKKKAFTSVDSDKMQIICPSRWLKGIIDESFLNKYESIVIPNEIDHSIFKPTISTFRDDFCLNNKIVVLAVASPWNERKGLSDVLRLAEELDPRKYAIVMVGVDKKLASKLDAKVVAIRRTNSKRKLAEIYSSADVFINPTYDDNYPTVNLEALACGCPVITYNTGGSAETLETSQVISKSVPTGDYESLKNAVISFGKKDE